MMPATKKVITSMDLLQAYYCINEQMMVNKKQHKFPQRYIGIVQKSIFPDRILLVTTLAMEIVVMTQSIN